MIPIENVYYMLSYAFQVLQKESYQDLATEKFHNINELYAAILAKGISVQLKRGLVRSYIDRTETISTLRGKMEVSDSIKTQAFLRRQMVCTYDDFSVNMEMNQILKTTAVILMRSDIRMEQKKTLRNLMMFFSDVDEIDLHSVNWNRTYSRNDQTYQMLIGICHLVYQGLLQSQKSGERRLMDFRDEQLPSHLYEKFILEYYRKEHPELAANASFIPWELDDGVDDMLPRMKTDITLSTRDGRDVLIIDAKYYAQTTQVQFGVNTLHSGNLYQIFTYVKNRQAGMPEGSRPVSGMLLYAKTDEEIVPNQEYQMSGNRITVRTLDLNKPFREIAAELDRIANLQGKENH